MDPALAEMVAMGALTAAEARALSGGIGGGAAAAGHPPGGRSPAEAPPCDDPVPRHRRHHDDEAGETARHRRDGEAARWHARDRGSEPGSLYGGPAAPPQRSSWGPAAPQPAEPPAGPRGVMSGGRRAPAAAAPPSPLAGVDPEVAQMFAEGLLSEEEVRALCPEHPPPRGGTQQRQQGVRFADPSQPYQQLRAPSGGALRRSPGSEPMHAGAREQVPPTAPSLPARPANTNLPAPRPPPRRSPASPPLPPGVDPLPKQSSPQRQRPAQPANTAPAPPPRADPNASPPRADPNASPPRADGREDSSLSEGMTPAVSDTCVRHLNRRAMLERMQANYPRTPDDRQGRQGSGMSGLGGSGRQVSSLFPRANSSALVPAISYHGPGGSADDELYSFNADGVQAYLLEGRTPPAKDGDWEDDGPKDGSIFSKRIDDAKRDGVTQIWFYNRTLDKHFLVSCPKGAGKEKRGTTVERKEQLELVMHPGNTGHFLNIKEGECTESAWSVTTVDTQLPPRGVYREYLTAREHEAARRLQAEMKAVATIAQRGGVDPTVPSNQRRVVDLCTAHVPPVPYVDLSFKPVRDTLGLRNAPQAWAGWAWLRPRQFLPPGAQPALFVADEGEERVIEPGDIDQGRMSDCYLLSALGCVAEHPELIRRIFMRDEANRVPERKVGAWSLRICKDGWWRQVVVDDCFPCDGLNPVYGSNRQQKNELWVPLLEKAYAKCCGSYKAIEKPPGDPVEAFADLTGYTYERFPGNWRDRGQEHYYETLKQYIQTRSGLTIHTYDEDPPELPKGSYKKVGLVAGHAFTLLDVRDAVTDDGTPLRMCRIRNPHGDDREWKGDWSDSSELWEANPKLVEELDFEAGDDGSFWICWDDVRKWFEGGGICFLARNWCTLRVRSAWNRCTPGHVLEVVAHEASSAAVCLHQTDRRITLFESTMRGSEVGDQYVPLMLAVLAPAGPGRWRVARVDEDPMSPDGGKSNPDDNGRGQYWRGRDCQLDYNFQPTAGDQPYYIVWSIHPDPHVDPQYRFLVNQDTVSRPIIMSVHAEKKFATVRVREAGQYGDFLRRSAGTVMPYSPGPLCAAEAQWGWDDVPELTEMDMRSMGDPQQPTPGSCQ